MVLSLPMRAVLTGGPGTGKSTLLAALAEDGFHTFPEVARGILQASDGMTLRADHPCEFAEAMLIAEHAAWLAAKPGWSVYDRGFPDIVGFLELESIPVSAEIAKACNMLKYSGPIFRAPPWRAIYVQDEERIQSWEQATHSDWAVCTAWNKYGYDLVDLPFSSVMDRLQFVRDRLCAWVASPVR